MGPSLLALIKPRELIKKYIYIHYNKPNILGTFRVTTQKRKQNRKENHYILFYLHSQYKSIHSFFFPHSRFHSITIWRKKSKHRRTEKINIYWWLIYTHAVSVLIDLLLLIFSFCLIFLTSSSSKQNNLQTFY